MEQFKYLQHIIVLGMIVNGESRDVGGRFIRIRPTGDNKGMAEVEVNTVLVNFPPDKIMDAQEYWDKKRKE